MQALGLTLIALVVIYVIGLYVRNVRVEAKARARRASMARHPAGRGL